MVRLSKDQVRRLLRPIKAAMADFVGLSLGPSALTHEEESVLKEVGVDPKKYKEFSDADAAFQFGMLSHVLGHERAKRVSYEDLLKFAEQGGYIPLDKRERAALDAAKRMTYAHVKSLSDRVESEATKVIAESEAQAALREELEIGILLRRSSREILSRFAERLGSWELDLSRIVETEHHRLFDMGRAAAIEREDGPDARVYKDVYPGACHRCIKLYLTAGIGSAPRVYKLSELKHNGDNIGVDSKSWKPVVGPTHPWCRCTLHRVLDGVEWSDNKKQFEAVRPPRRRERPKVKVVFSGKEYMV